jgi:hypothetical protein
MDLYSADQARRDKKASKEKAIIKLRNEILAHIKNEAKQGKRTYKYSTCVDVDDEDDEGEKILKQMTQVVDQLKELGYTVKFEKAEEITTYDMWIHYNYTISW